MIIGFPHRPGTGGPGSFQSRFQKELESLGWRIVFLTESTATPDVIIIVGGTRRLVQLWRFKRKGIPIIYRLDGILWLHRCQWVGLRRFFGNELRNVIFKVTHGYLADHVIYQSAFVREWWQQCGWREVTRFTIIHNGVDLGLFSGAQDGSQLERQKREIAVICVEGHLDYSPYAVDLLNELSARLAPVGMAMRVYGGFANASNREKLATGLDYRGLVARDDIHCVYRNGIYLSLDVNAACPNTVIEAMSSGLPVVGFDTGALAELVPKDCGRVVDFGGDPWKLDAPAVDPLVSAIFEVANDYDRFSRNALNHAGDNFDIKLVTARYIQVIEEVLGMAQTAGISRGIN